MTEMVWSSCVFACCVNQWPWSLTIDVCAEQVNGICQQNHIFFIFYIFRIFHIFSLSNPPPPPP